MEREQGALAKEQLAQRQKEFKFQQEQAAVAQQQTQAEQMQAFQAILGATMSPDQEMARAVATQPQIQGLLQNLGNAASPPNALQQAPLAAQAIAPAQQGVQRKRAASDLKAILEEARTRQRESFARDVEKADSSAPASGNSLVFYELTTGEKWVAVVRPVSGGVAMSLSRQGGGECEVTMASNDLLRFKELLAVAGTPGGPRA